MSRVLTPSVAPPILLDFLNRDSREMFGLFSDASREHHVALLTEALNLSVFICGPYCVTPPGPIAECQYAQEALARRWDYLSEGLIKFPIRETSLSEFFEKKLDDYRPTRKHYKYLYSSESRRFFENVSNAVLSRTIHVGEFIAGRWEAGPDADKLWSSILHTLGPKYIDSIRRLGRELANSGTAVNWPGLSARINEVLAGVPPIFRRLLQHYYFLAYLGEYSARVLANLPFARVDFDLPGDDLEFDYLVVRGALRACAVWDYIARASASSIIRLRNTHGYFVFRRVFRDIASVCSTWEDVARAFAFALGRNPTLIEKTDIVGMARRSELVVGPDGLDLSDLQVHAVSYRLMEICSRLDVGDAIPEHPDHKSKPQGRRSMRPVAAVFVALQEEREFLTKKWGLTHRFPEISWSGNVGFFDVLVYGHDEAGRVSAAVDTCGLLAGGSEPNLIVVTGIAGGFGESGVQRGDVLVAEVIADLASRKIREDAGSILPEFRPRSFDTDSRLRDYLKSGSFDQASWAQKVIGNGLWPPGRHPTLHFGTVASLDEVVSADTWRSALLDAWPKLLGVEMEAGGVCSAAKRAGIPVAVLRGVSDLADPTKSDDMYRRLAIDAAATVLDIAFNSEAFARSFSAKARVAG